MKVVVIILLSLIPFAWEIHSLREERKDLLIKLNLAEYNRKTGKYQRINPISVESLMRGR